MLDIALAFMTGLTTGGLSCLAVQGGLLASSLAAQIEQSPAAAGMKRGGGLAAPIAAFLSAKLAAYTLLGFLLGLAGSMFQLSPGARAAFQIAVGLFMLGSALRLLNAHPIFRYFAFEPPAFVRRYIRRASNQNGGASLFTPLCMGALTVLIPCGITQAMMAAALASGDGLRGAVLMFAFTLGASPVFFAAAYFVMRLGARIEKHFTRLAAAALILLGLYSIDTGATLAGSPVSLPLLAARAAPADAGANQVEAPDSRPGQGSPEAAPEDETTVTVNVKPGGYFPSVVHARAGQALRLRLVSQDVYTCSLSFVIPSLGVQENLEPTDEVVIDVPAQPGGATIPFSCSMGMYTGKIVFD